MNKDTLVIRKAGDVVDATADPSPARTDSAQRHQGEPC